MSIASLSDEQAYLHRQFRGMLIVITIAVALGTSSSILGKFIFSAPWDSIEVITSTVFLVFTALLWWLLQHNRLYLASLIFSSLMLLLAAIETARNVAPANWMFVVSLLIAATVLSLPYISSHSFRRLTITTVAIGVGIIGYIAVLQWQSDSALMNPIISTCIVFVGTMFLLWQFSNLHHLLVTSLRGSNTELLALKASLEQQVAERTAELQATLASLQAQNDVQQRLLTDIERQQQLIHALSVPVLPISSKVLVLPLIGSLDTARLDLIRQHALAAIERSRARVVVLDVTGVPDVDTQAAQGLLHVVHATRVMGSQCVLAGMRPELAQALVRLGVDLGSLRTYATLQRALDVVR